VNKIYIIAISSIVAMCLGGCGEENNNSNSRTSYIDKTGEKIDVEIADNISLNASVPKEERELFTYKVCDRPLDINEEAGVFGVKLENGEMNDENNFYDFGNGAYFSASDGNIEYVSDERYNTLNEMVYEYYQDDDSSDDNINKAQVERATELLTAGLKLSENEELYLIHAKKLDNEAYQEGKKYLEEDMGFGEGKMEAKEADRIVSDSTYYYSFGIKIDGIPISNFKEASLNYTSEDSYGKQLSIEMIMDDNNVKYILSDGIEELESSEDKSLISIDEAISKLKEKYDVQIVPEKEEINNIRLEYIPLFDVNNSAGSMEPYWCFYYKDGRTDAFNALTGGDLAYE
jgi:hypothetical protein